MNITLFALPHEKASAAARLADRPAWTGLLRIGVMFS